MDIYMFLDGSRGGDDGEERRGGRGPHTTGTYITAHILNDYTNEPSFIVIIYLVYLQYL